MHALGRAARRLQLANGSHGDKVRSVTSVLHLVRNATLPAATPDRAQQRPLHGSGAELPCRAAADVPPSSAGLRTLLHRTSSLQQCGVSEEAMTPLSATSGSAQLVRSYSASACRGAARPGQTLSRPDPAVRCYSTSAAFVTEHGGGAFRTTAAAGSETSASQSAESGAGFDSSGYGAFADEHSEAAEDDGRRRQILDAALKHVKERGWSVAALQAGAQDSGLSPAAAGLIAGGGFDLIQHFQRRCDADTVAELAARPVGMGNLSENERLSHAVQTRLRMIVPYIDSWPQALSIQAMPQHAPAALRRLAALVDDIWHAAGDTSSGYDWYTKRATLAGVYSTTELYMLTDFSPDYSDTWAALDRRVNEAMGMSRVAGKAGAAFASALGIPGEFLGSMQQRHGRSTER